MSRLQRLIEYLWPELILAGTPWYPSWAAEHRRQFATRSRIFFVLVALGYIGHYYYVDIPNNKEPIESWFVFRMTMAGMAAICVGAYLVDGFIQSKFVKAPAILVAAAACITQAYVPVYFPEAPWFYVYLFLFTSVLILSTSPTKSVLFALFVVVLIYDPLVKAGVPTYQIASANVVSVIVIFGVRGSYIAELRNYALEKERDTYRDEIISLGKEYEDRLKSFIPRVIADRLETMIQSERRSVLDATVQVLTPKKKQIACLWSDIRGFTQSSKDLDTFLAGSVVPEVRMCTDAIERRDGIPRKIGDLIFAYFDGSSPEKNILQALLSAFELSELNKDINAMSEKMDVRRYILVSAGEALVGNIGGVNSAVEITALGPPVNYLARLDEATKSEEMSKYLRPGDIVLSSATTSMLTRYQIVLDMIPICLKSENIQIRDFPEVERILVVRPTRENYEKLKFAYETNA